MTITPRVPLPFSRPPKKSPAVDCVNRRITNATRNLENILIIEECLSKSGQLSGDFSESGLYCTAVRAGLFCLGEGFCSTHV